MNIIKKKLSNGLTVIFIKHGILPKVSMQLWYGVGSKHETSGIRGIAHLIEHMIFKGTKKLSEGAIDGIVYKLSGYCNAFTSYDYTGYLFDVPTQNYLQVFPIMSDCMQNCTFRQELLNSEIKTVIQELKMGKDDHASVLMKELIAGIFADHPYCHQIIGYKQDIWSMKTDDLLKFYHQYYVPRNAALVVAGNFDEDECFAQIEREFSEIPAGTFSLDQKLPDTHERDIASKTVTLYRDVQQPLSIMVWEVPGVSSASWYIYDLLVSLLGSGRGSRLYQRLVYGEDLVHDVEAFVYDLSDHAAFGIMFRPKNPEHIELITKAILDELRLVTEKGFSESEWERAVARSRMSILNLCEDASKLATMVASLYLATGDEHAIDQYNTIDIDSAKQIISDLVLTYFRPSCVHLGSLLPASEEDTNLWSSLQEARDEQDAAALSNLVRTEPVSSSLSLDHIAVRKPDHAVFPAFEKFVLENGLTVYTVPVPGSEIAECVVDFKSKHYYDDHAGAMAVLFDVMEEGTKGFPGTSFAQALESKGMDFETSPGFIALSMLPELVEDGIQLLSEYILRPELAESAIERVKQQNIADIKEFWDDPELLAKQLIRSAVYQQHPYGKNPSGTEESVRAIDKTLLNSEYRHYISPRQTVMVFSGKIDPNVIQKQIEKYFSSWDGPEIVDVLTVVPELVQKKSIHHAINRDQSVLVYGGLSVPRMDPSYDSLLLFDQVFGGGVLMNMRSRLFAIRERTGMFYSIGGTMLAGCGKHAGMMYIRAITSPDLVAPACSEIEKVITSVVPTITDDEIKQAQHAIANTLVESYATAKNCASSLIFMHRYELDKSYFENRMDKIYALSTDQIRKDVSEYLDLQNFVTLTVGRG